MHGGEDLKSNDVITIDNSQIETAFDSLLPILQKTMPQVMKRIGSLIVDTAKGMVPVDTARLKGSITHIETDTGMEFSTSAGTNVEYAPYVEYGTGDSGQWSGGATYRGHDSGAKYTEGWPGMYARPYLRPALYDFEDVYTGMVNTTIKEAFREASK